MDNKTWDNIADYIYNISIKTIDNRKVVMYGYSYRNSAIAKKLSERGITIAFYVDGAIGKQMVKGVYKPDVLKNAASQYYIIIPMLCCDEIIKLLNSYGYMPNDYIYLGNLRYEIKKMSEAYFEDNYGNRIIIESKNQEDIKEHYIDRLRQNIKFKGFDSTVVVNDNCVLGKQFNLSMKDNSYFELGENTKINCLISINDNCEFRCGNNCVFSQSGLIEMYDSKIIIGNQFTIEPGYTFRTLRKSAITIGDDCMFSYNINMRTNDGHSIFDVNTGNNINSTDKLNESRNIYIGNHVWLGMNVTVLYNSNINDGSIIGAMSLVKSEVPNNCIAAGVPAHITRKDIAWSRNNSSLDIDECGMEYVGNTKL